MANKIKDNSELIQFLQQQGRGIYSNPKFTLTLICG